jgi:hypothetical protein
MALQGATLIGGDLTFSRAQGAPGAGERAFEGELLVLAGAALWGACSGDVVTPTTGGGAVTLRIEKLARKREAKIRDLYRSALDAFRETP